jgi:ketosteroid isomerase-like protein
MSMSQNDTLHLAQEFLARMGSGAEPVEIASLFSENIEWEIAGDTGVLPWIGEKSGRAAVTDFVTDSRTMMERISFEVHDILTDGSLASRIKRADKIVKTDFAIVLTVVNDFVSQAAR